jgi:Zn-dependent metalloprotease
MRVRFTTFITTLLLFIALNVKAQAPFVRLNTDLGTPAYVEFAQGNEPLFQDWQLLLPKLIKTGSGSNWRIYSQITDDLGQTHYRIQQYYNGVSLENGVGIIHTFKGKIISINGEFIPTEKLAGSIAYTIQDARTLALRQSPAELYYWQDEQQNQILKALTGNNDTSWFPKGKLVYCPENLNYLKSHRLAYKFEVYALKPLSGNAIYIDAENGNLIASEPLILHTDVKGTAVTAFSGTR